MQYWFLTNKNRLPIFTADNLGVFQYSLRRSVHMAKKKAKKSNDEEKTKRDFEREQMLEQAHQLELQKNYEYDEELDESKD